MLSSGGEGGPQLERWKSAVAVKSRDDKGMTNNAQTVSTQPVFSSSWSAGIPSKVFRDTSTDFWSNILQEICPHLLN